MPTISKDDAEELTAGLGQNLAGSWRLIDRFNRMGVPQALGLSVEDWVRQRLGGYVRLSVEDRRAAVAELAEKGESNRSIAGILGVDPETVNRDVRAANAAPDDADADTDQALADETAANAAPTPAKKAAAKRTAHEEIAKFAFQQPARDVPEGPPIRLGDFRDLSVELADNSVDLIFTDPPYDDKSTHLFDPLGALAARVLKPGGSLVTYLGHMQLIEAAQHLSRHLRYWHPLCCLHAGPAARMKEFGVIETFKPMLWYVKGTRSDKHTFIESAVTGSREKDHHEWQQAESEAAYFIERLSPENGLIVDPFSGGGTTIVAALKLNRRAVGYEVNAKHHTKAMARIGQ